jgi:hypothetical protein
MKSIYYNWKKLIPSSYPLQNNIMPCEETWGQFVDLEINDYYNDGYKNKYTGLMKYEPSLLSIQENIVNIQSKIIIYDSSYTLILSISALAIYAVVQIFICNVSKYHGNGYG